jgi:glucose/arabinose dehydrogenase
MRTVRMLAIATGVLALAACGSSSADEEGDRAAPGVASPAAPGAAGAAPGGTAPGSAASGRATTTDGGTAHAAPTTIATGLDTPWEIAFLPSGDALVSERGGTVRRIAKGGRGARALARVPGVQELGEGGLLGLAVSPTYERDRLVYAYLTTRADNRIVRFRLTASTRAIRPRVVVRGLRSAAVHNGGRIAFGPDGKLYAGVGDAGDPALAQDRSSQNGKILRMNPDGSVPADNPFRGSRVLSLGHRNPQGLAFDRAGRLWASEFGQDAFDEVNLIRPGRNYGWPRREGRGDTAGGRYANPLVTWRTDDASPSGAAIVGSRLHVAALKGERLWTVPLRGMRTGAPRATLRGRYGRLRAVAAAPDGSLWIATSNRDGRGDVRAGDDRVLRVPAR